METKELKYLWRVVDCNGVILNQLDENNVGRKLDEIEKVMQRPYTIYLISKVGLPTVSVKINGTKRFIYFRRINKKVSMMGGLFRGQQTVSVIYALGWQDTINGKNIKSIMWIDSVTGEINETGE